MADWLRFFRASWTLDRVTPPWGDRPALLAVLQAQRPANGGFADSYLPLPDDDRVSARTGGIPWVYGGTDGVWSQHGAAPAHDLHRPVHAALHALLDRATDTTAAQFYACIDDELALNYVDALVDALVAALERQPTVQTERLYAVAVWLTTRAADREAVKLGLALLGLFPATDLRDVLRTFGAHEEFTKYAAVALLRTERDAEPLLFELAQHLRGWGRIELVERLASTSDPQIQAWMLRDGYRNDILPDYTAYTCATTGDLCAALAATSDPDDALLTGAGAILTTLLNGRDGPGAFITAYADGAEATEHYLRHLARGPLPLDALRCLQALRTFLAEPDGPATDPTFGWPQRRPALDELITALLADPTLMPRLHAALDSPDDATFYAATDAARTFGIDLWDAHWRRAQDRAPDWTALLQTGDRSRAARVVTLAETRLPLDALASGPALDPGVGPAFEAHRALETVVQDLARFPGLGAPLIAAALRSPVLRSRNLAALTLDAWPRAAWPAPLRPVLEAAADDEPDDDLRDRLRCLLAGELLDPDQPPTPL